VRSIRWIPWLLAAVSSVAQAQYAPPPPYPYGGPPPPPPPGYGPAPTYGPPVVYEEPQRARGRIEISGYAGYQLSTDAGTCCGEIVIDGSAVYGAALGYELRQGYGIELSWFYVPTNVFFRSNGFTFPSSDAKSGLGEHWIQIGGVYGPVRLKGKLEPYATVTAGVVIISPSTARLTDGTTLTPSTEVEFAFTVGLGLKFWVTPMIAIRAEFRTLVPVFFNSTAFYVGTGGGGLGVSGGIPFAQFAFTGGLTLAL
jgi:opacity protein-like surface antigen